MLKTVPQTGTKIRCIDNGGFYFLTNGKAYDVLRTTDEGFEYLDDEGDELFYYIDGSQQEKFEIVSENEIKIGNFVKLKEWDDFLFVCDISGDYLEIEQKFNGQVYKTWYSISLGFIKQGDEEMNEKQEDQKQDEFQVGDKVWDILFGAGEVVEIYPGESFSVTVSFSHAWETYTEDGRYFDNANRSLFFSEPKIEASVNRPFVSTLVGKKVVVESEKLVLMMACTVVSETHDMLYVIDESGDKYHWIKDDISAIYEVSSENLLKK